MKTSLAHLPIEKQNELAAVVKIINEMIDAEFVILFGSYARGDWVEDRYTGEDGITYEYQSDFDLLIAVEDLPKYEYKGYREKIKRKAKVSEYCETRLSIIMESIANLQKELRNGSYFFTDIKKEGVLLYDSGRFELPEPKPLNAQERKKRAEINFQNWFESASDFLFGFEKYFDAQKYKNAAFELHQAVERFYHTLLLVFTDYKPKLHDIEALGIQVSRFDGRLKGVFPKNTEEEKHRFDLLKRAYTEARYNMGYRITKEELEYLAGRVTELQQLTNEICQAKIDSFLE